MFTTPYLATLTWKPPQQYRDECPDKILLTVLNHDASVHEDIEVSNTETVETVKVNPDKCYSACFTVKHKKGKATSEVNKCPIPGM